MSSSFLYDINAAILSIIDVKYLIWLFAGLLTGITAIQALLGRRFNLATVFAVFSAMPLLAPLLADLMGYEYLTSMNHYLQDDDVLIASASSLLFIFTVFVIAGAAYPVNYCRVISTPAISMSNGLILVIFALNLILVSMYLEPGTIINKSYSELKNIDNPFSSSVNQILNLSLAIILATIPSVRRLRLVQFIIIVFLIISLIMSRRTLSVGLFILLLYTMKATELKFKSLLLVIIAFLSLWIVGELRSAGIINYVNEGEGLNEKTNFSMPGGGAQIFVSTIGVLDLLIKDRLSFPMTFPALLWPSGVYESSIYKSFGYEYNGGMHLATILYWNSGLLGVIICGFIIGRLLRRADYYLLHLNVGSMGTLQKMLSIGFAITLTNFVWYNPVATIKLFLAIIVIFPILCCVRYVINKRSS